MSLLILRKPAVLQPAGPVEIDPYWAKKLRYCSTLGPNLVDLRTGKRGVPSGSPPVVPTRVGLARSFVSASSQYITLPTSDMVSGYPLTVACWVSTVATGAGQVIYSLNGTNYSAIAGYINSNTNAVLTQNTGSGDTLQGKVCPLGLSYIVAVHRSGSWDLYVNGVRAATQSVGSNWGQPAAGNHSIGNRLNGASPRYHDGTVSDLCVFEGELSVADIKALSANPNRVYRTSQQIWIPAAVGGDTTINGALGTAVASGLMGTVNANRTIAGALGTATASGFRGVVNANRTIAGALGTAVASGLAGNVNANRTIAGALGTATASGFQGTVTNGNTTTIAGSLGTAVATGFTGGVTWNRYIAGVLGVATASGFTGGVANGTAAPAQEGGGWMPPQGRRKTRKEVYAERVKLGILPPAIVRAAEKVAVVAETVAEFKADRPRYEEMFMRELNVTKWAPDYTRAIQIQIELMQQDDEDILLLMM